MNKLMLIATVCALALTGCKSITVNNRGEALAFDDNGAVVMKADGNPLVLNKGWQVDYFQHWNWQKFDSLESHVRPEDISLTINQYASGADSNLTALVSTSLTGLGTLALNLSEAYAKIYGGAVSDSAINAGIALYKKFVGSGGNEAKATITAADGNVTVSDGTITCTGDDCYLCRDGECSYNPIQ